MPLNIGGLQKQALHDPDIAQGWRPQAAKQQNLRLAISCSQPHMQAHESVAPLPTNQRRRFSTDYLHFYLSDGDNPDRYSPQKSTTMADNPMRLFNIILGHETFKVSAIDKASSQVLDAFQDVQGRLAAARKLLLDNLDILGDAEKDIVVANLKSADYALSQLNDLLEPVDDSRSTATDETRPRFEMRESPNAKVFLAGLGFATHNLTSTTALLTSKSVNVLSTNQGDPRPPAVKRLLAELPTNSPISRYLGSEQLTNGNRRVSEVTTAFRTPYIIRSHLAKSTNNLESVHLAELPGDTPIEYGKLPTRPQSQPSSDPDFEAGHLSYGHVFKTSGSRKLDEILPNNLPSLSRSPVEAEPGPPPSSSPRPSHEAISTQNISTSSGRLTGRARTRRWLEAQTSKPKG